MSAERVLTLATYARRGGAGISAHRLHAALRRAGRQGLLLASDVDDSEADGLIAAGERVSTADDVLFAALQRQGVDAQRTALSNTMFSLGFNGLTLHGRPALNEADLLHLHWVTGLLSIDGVARLLHGSAPVVWTLHDMWPMTGGCHYAFDCDGFTRTCRGCPQLQSPSHTLPQLRLNDRRHGWTRRLPHIVTPTRWMHDQAARSTLLRRADVSVIPNGVDLAEFAPVDRAVALRALGLPDDGVYILFVAESHAEKRKGYAELLSALELLGEALPARADRPAIRLLSVGDASGMPPSVCIESIALGTIADTKRMREVYGAADIFVLPSLQDNLPNTLIEAMACGRPVIAFDVGGVREAIIAGETGLVVPVGDIHALMNALLTLVGDKKRCAAMAKAARARAEREDRSTSVHSATVGSTAICWRRVAPSASRRSRALTLNRRLFVGAPNVRSIC